MKRYASGVYREAGFGIFNDHFPDFRDLVLSLPTCRDLAESDVASIAAEGLLAFYPQQRAAKDKTGKYLDLTAELADHYTKFLESLPRSYLIRITLPRIHDLGTSSTRISDHIEIRTAEQGSDVAAQDKNLLSSLLIPKPPVEASSCTLEISVSGFATASLETQGAADAIALAKQTAFLLLSTGTVERSHWGEGQSTASLLDQTSGEEEPLALPEGIAHIFSRLELVENELQVLDPSKGLLTGWRKAESAEERHAAFSRKVAPIGRFFSTPEASGHRRIAAGMEWYQDSVSGQDQTMSFLAACIGIEAVLGEEESGLSELSRRLIDRYSFMLGRDRDERASLAKQFEGVLRVRGELVHARSTRLRARDRDRLSEVQQMLWNLLQHELRPLTKIP